MTTLYNCKHSGDQYRITKFVEDNPEGSYLCTFEECECPAGRRPMCRHREMLPKFIQRGAVNTGWFFDYDRGGWVDLRTDDEVLPPLPNGVAVLSLDDPEELHNAIAEAIGEDNFDIAHVAKLVDAAGSKSVDPVGSNPTMGTIAPSTKATSRKPDGRRL